MNINRPRGIGARMAAQLPKRNFDNKRYVQLRDKERQAARTKRMQQIQSRESQNLQRSMSFNATNIFAANSQNAYQQVYNVLEGVAKAKMAEANNLVENFRRSI